MASLFCKMAAAKTALLSYTFSVANVAVPLVSLYCMQAERSIDARNWAELRAQILKSFEEYRTALRIRNGTKNTELCARLLKNASNIRMCMAIKWPPRSVQHPFCLHLQRYSRDSSFYSLVANRLGCCKKLAESRAHGTKRFKEYRTYQEYRTALRIQNAGQITANA